MTGMQLEMYELVINRRFVYLCIDYHHASGVNATRFVVWALKACNVNIRVLWFN